MVAIKLEETKNLSYAVAPFASMGCEYQLNPPYLAYFFRLSLLGLNCGNQTFSNRLCYIISYEIKND